MAKSYEDYYKELLAKNNADGDKQIADYGSIIDKQTSATNKTIDDAMNFTTGQYDTKIGETKQDYEELYDVNEVQKKINERNVAERMANLGLTDSGLNRTQQTAIQLSHGNARTNLSISEQKAVDTLKNELAAKLADYTAQKQTNLSNAEASKAQYALDVRDAARTNAAANATELYNQQVQAENELRIAQIEAAAAAEKARIEAAAKQATTYKTDYKTEKSDLYNFLKDNKDDNDLDYAAQLIDAYCTKYDIDPNTQYGAAELSTLLKVSGMTLNEYKHYIQNGTAYTSQTEYNKTGSGRVNSYNYKTDGKQTYKIEVVKDSWNPFGYGIDGNAEVKIKYADGSDVYDKSIQLKDLKDDAVAKAINKIINGNEGKTIELELDLSKENFK